MGPSRRARQRWPRPGTIPARAGETHWHGDHPRGLGDHPRSRGGDSTSVSVDEGFPGPSPLARGRLRQVLPDANHVGTIPARAGETLWGIGLPGLPRDHPRSRGGDAFGDTTSSTLPGPSPLARGRHIHLVIREPLEGTIPARAGETSAGYTSSSPCGDHPRSRGGDIGGKAAKSAEQGPSPLARGRRAEDSHSRRAEGTIPARAGETGSG